LEHNDNNNGVTNLILPDNATFTSHFDRNLLNGVVTIRSEVPTFKPNEDGTAIQSQQAKMTAIPYYAWANRGASSMQVWLPRKVMDVEVIADK
jgi:DUF1680 family protein